MSAVWKIGPAPAPPETATSAAARPLRKALQSAYRQLDDCIVQMERATGAATPNMVLLANARYRIGQASYARRQLVHEACDFLLARVSPLEAESVRSLQRDNSAYARVSTEHVRTWPPARIEREWSDYREASRRIRARMKQATRSEQLRLFPLLARYEHH